MKKRTLDQEIVFRQKIARKMMDDMDQKLADAVEREDWRKAADLKSYIDGMNQVVIIFDGLEETQ